MTTANLQRQCSMHYKFSYEVRPPPLIRRYERTRSMTCSFEEIAESEEEDTQIPEPQQSGRSQFAVLFQSPFAERRGSSLQNLSPTLARKLAPRLCRGFSDPVIRRRTSPSSMFTSLSLDRHESGTIDFLTLPPIPEATASSSSPSDYKDDGD